MKEVLEPKKKKNFLIIHQTNYYRFVQDRRPIEPPPILQLHWENCSEEELK